ncbi:hypothetical protein [Sorangium sp. So ce1024]|uniref:hypothetical protein n=1 Tax=Sorangium sp. So ce1024 TaxID=3133327 RepID=UPI003F0DD692
MSGWPEIEADTVIEDDRRPPTFNADGTIVCYQSAPAGQACGNEGETPIAATWTFRREGMKLVLQGAWTSEEEQARRKADEEARKRSP